MYFSGVLFHGDLAAERIPLEDSDSVADRKVSARGGRGILVVFRLRV
jgi:hypothetical protein